MSVNVTSISAERRAIHLGVPTQRITAIKLRKKLPLLLERVDENKNKAKSFI